MDAHIVAPSRKAFSCATGTPIAPHASLDETARTDVAVVADPSLAADADPRGKWPAASAWLRQQLEKGATVCSVCTGSPNPVAVEAAGEMAGSRAPPPIQASARLP